MKVYDVIFYPFFLSPFPTPFPPFQFLFSLEFEVLLFPCPRAMFYTSLLSDGGLGTLQKINFPWTSYDLSFISSTCHQLVCCWCLCCLLSTLDTIMIVCYLFLAE
ncbi:hypothetical protein ASPWEDRAFT_286859 [Aspergillus wentii DTO 134E9]|uniref:Uncharacterized protein n=1 Tax=Aspergillus wentii DTO 134E9 TaxID=1073089 RepID=A0A1L9S3R5_ASPWE|nr:uncharacterized protein ASPWEDRAFT_286859 [Aspergillus wentii DTO 134E9]OJJ41807.1 hypothetical protein ASPWEDRAFT_286859 [Aspergillus wentii DTO 134E9]